MYCVRTHLLPELSVNGRRLDREVHLHRVGDGHVRQRVAGRPHPTPEALRVVGLFDAGNLPQAGACGGCKIMFGIVRKRKGGGEDSDLRRKRRPSAAAAEGKSGGKEQITELPASPP